MSPRDRLLRTPRGVFAARDYGGSGRHLLLVHGAGHNLEVWTPLVERLKGSFHIASFDLRGHGQTPEESTEPEQYWRDLGAVSAAFGFKGPVLVGHSAGGYAVTAFAASGGDCSGVVALDGFTLDGRKTPEEAQAWHIPSEQLWTMFRYGWSASADEREAYVAEVCAKAPRDWLNAGIDAGLVAAFTRRAFLERGGRYVRRPTMEAMEVVGRPDPAADVYPALDLYEKVSVPLGFVFAKNGLYGGRWKDLKAVAAQRRGDRHAVRVDCGHNVHMQEPRAVAEFILKYFGPDTRVQARRTDY